MYATEKKVMGYCLICKMEISNKAKHCKWCIKDMKKEYNKEYYKTKREENIKRTFDTDNHYGGDYNF